MKLGKPLSINSYPVRLLSSHLAPNTRGLFFDVCRSESAALAIRSNALSMSGLYSSSSGISWERILCATGWAKRLEESLRATTVGSTIGLSLRSPDLQERSYYLNLIPARRTQCAERLHAAQPGKPSAYQVHQDSLNLVVAVCPTATVSAPENGRPLRRRRTLPLAPPPPRQTIFLLIGLDLSPLDGRRDTQFVASEETYSASASDSAPASRWLR